MSKAGPVLESLQSMANLAERVREDRLWERLMTMARIGAIPGNGVNRQALSNEDIAARRQLIEWARARGFGIAVDGIGNLFVSRSGRAPAAPPVLTGSHLDSQPKGGRFDGVYGVLAGLEALEALEDAGLATDRSVVTVAWTNEEGGRFAPGAMGSMVFSGARRLQDCLEARDAEGIRFGDALEHTLAATPEAEAVGFNFPVAGYVEAHIEQGPRLEAEGVPIGIVTGIQGLRWFEIEVLGESAHAGAAPMRGRRDALQAALAAVRSLNEIMHDETDTVRFTVGRFEVSPNTPNSVAGQVVFTIDLRHPDAEVLERLSEAVRPVCEVAATGCEVRVRETFDRRPCVFDKGMRELITDSARSLALPAIPLPSGAFHDALFLNDVCPTGMIFVPCEKGISHNPAENARPEDLAAGARVLALTLAKMAADPIRGS
jgi:N-carbamoyl-L-amino-acid hydrolase